MEKALGKQLGKKPKAMALNMGALEAGKKYAAEHLDEARSVSRRAHEQDGRARSSSRATPPRRWAACSPASPSSAGIRSRRRRRCRRRSSATCGSTAWTRRRARRRSRSSRPRTRSPRSAWSIGASWAGARAMTSTSGPGISLMSEFAGLAYYAEIPAVVFDIQRVGPSTGLPTRTAQGDLLFAALNSHGDTRHVLLLPASVEECYEMSMEAFDLAERLQTIDLRDERPRPRHEHLDVAAVHVPGRSRSIAARCSTRRSCASWARRGAATRTSTATAFRGARCRGRTCRRSSRAAPGHNEMAHYTERPDDYVKNLDRLARKFETAKTLVPQPIVEHDRRREVGIIAFGSSHWAVRGGARPAARGSRPQDVVPPPARVSVHAEVDDVHPPVRPHLRRRAEPRRADAEPAAHGRRGAVRHAACGSVLHYNGLPIDARSITDEHSARKSAGTRRANVMSDDRRRPPRSGPTASASTSRAIAAARRRCAPGAGTTRSPSASSTRSSRWASTRSAC